MTSNKLNFSFIIVNYETRDLLKDCLSSIYQSQKDETCEVIVIDNNSSDGSVEMVRREFPMTKLILNKKNLGFAKGCNQGIEHSRGKYIVLLNSDTELLPDTLKKLRLFFNKERIDPNIGIIGCKILNPDGSLQYSTGRFPSLWSTVVDMFRPYEKRKYCLAGYDAAHEVDWVTGAFMVIDACVVKDVGGFDERYFMYYEEVDWCLRAKKRGWKVFYIPQMTIIHKAPLASKKNLMNPKLASEVRRSHLFYFRKNHSGIIFFALSAATLLLLSFNILKWKTSFLSAKEIRNTQITKYKALLSSVWRTFLELSQNRNP